MSRPQSLLSTIGNFIFKKQFSFTIPWDQFKWADNYATYSTEGYLKNSTGYFAVNKVADKCGEIPLKLWRKQGKEEVEVFEHPVLDLLQSPNKTLHTYSMFVNLRPPVEAAP